MTAIFRSTPHALHVAYIVTSEPVRERSSLRSALIKIIESAGAADRRQAGFLEYLHGRSSGTVDFAGLTPIEVHAQCAMITAAVADHLKEAERSAVWVRYAKGAERWEGVENMVKRLRSALNLSSIDAIRYLVAEQSLSREQRDPAVSFPFISQQTNVPVRTLERAATQIRKQLRAYEHDAYDTLTPMFERDGLIEPYEQN